MGVLVYAESPGGKFKKSAFEAVYYGKKCAEMLGSTCIALVIGDASDAGQLGTYGADKVIHAAQGEGNKFNSINYTDSIKSAAEANGCKLIVMSHTADGKSLVGCLGVALSAGTVTGVTALPSTEDDFVVNKSVFSGKAIVSYRVNTDVKVLTVMGNSLQPEAIGSPVSVEQGVASSSNSQLEVKEKKVIDGTVPLPEAELVVSAGRGMKGPENWDIIEELADTLGATTACSRPVADSGWRPHHEHVGQTGVAIKPNLYIAIGISGAIQHLAGVNNSKVIVVINKDQDAPFFKAADYGVCADLFDVVPRLTTALKKFKEKN